MAKQISVSDDIYAMLLKIKGSGSFSDAIRNLFGKKNQKSQIKELMKYAGIWKDWDSAKELERQITNDRQRNTGREINW